MSVCLHICIQSDLTVHVWDSILYMFGTVCDVQGSRFAFPARCLCSSFGRTGFCMCFFSGACCLWILLFPPLFHKLMGSVSKEIENMLLQLF